MIMAKKDYIEEFIRKNRERFNEEEPLEGHFGRFEARLKKSHTGKKYRMNIIWRVAAAAIFVFLIVNQAIIWFATDKEKMISTEKTEGMSLASVSNEYKEVEFYYTNAIDNGLEQWDKLVSGGHISEEEQLMMKTELAEFEAVFDKLQKDLAASPNDDRVINAMIEYYQTKLSLINMIVDKLKEVKQKKNNNYETEI